MKWTIEESSIGGLYHVYNERRNRIAEFKQLDVACLVAAAPQLLEELRGMLHIFDRNLPEGSIGADQCVLARSAIDKAIGVGGTGEQ